MGRPPDCNCVCIGTTSPPLGCFTPWLTNFCDIPYIGSYMVPYIKDNENDPFIFEYTSLSSDYTWNYNSCQICHDNSFETRQCEIDYSTNNPCENVVLRGCCTSYYYDPYPTNQVSTEICILEIQNIVYPYQTINAISGGYFLNSQREKTLSLDLSNLPTHWNPFCNLYCDSKLFWRWNWWVDAECACIRVTTLSGVSFQYYDCDSGSLQTASIPPGLDNTPVTQYFCMKITNWANFISCLLTDLDYCGIYESNNCSISLSNPFCYEDDLIILSGSASFEFVKVCKWDSDYTNFINSCYPGGLPSLDCPGESTTTSTTSTTTTTTTTTTSTTTQEPLGTCYGCVGGSWTCFESTSSGCSLNWNSSPWSSGLCDSLEEQAGAWWLCVNNTPTCYEYNPGSGATFVPCSNCFDQPPNALCNPLDP